MSGVSPGLSQVFCWLWSPQRSLWSLSKDDSQPEEQLPEYKNPHLRFFTQCYTSGQLEDENSAFEAWELIPGVGKAAKCLRSAHTMILILFSTARVIILHLLIQSGIRKFWVLEQVWVFLSRYFLAHFCHIYDLKTFRMAAFTLLFLFFLVGMSISD